MRYLLLLPWSFFDDELKPAYEDFCVDSLSLKFQPESTHLI